MSLGIGLHFVILIVVTLVRLLLSLGHRASSQCENITTKQTEECHELALAIGVRELVIAPDRS